MPNRYRRVKWNNIGTGAKVRIRRSIWLAELQDFGTVTDDAVDLPTSGATHRGPNLGAVSGTRQYVNLSTVNDLTVVDTQDHGLITDNAITAVAWKLNPENTNVVTPPTPTYSVSHNAGSSVNEGSQVTFTLTTTNVADGTTLYFTTTYAQANGGSTTSSDFTGANASPVTVNNNTASFTVTVAADNTTESGNEYFYGNFGTSYAYADILATSSIIEIIDTSQAASGPSEPSVGTWLYGGEAVAAGWNETHWNATTSTITVKFDTSSTATSSFGTPNDEWEWVLDDWAAGNGSGDVIQIRGGGITPVYMSINGTVTKTQIGSSDTYYYAIPVNVTSGTVPANSGGYIVLNQYLQHQHNG